MHGRVAVAGLLMLVPLATARAACVDPSGIPEARDAVEAACPCAAAATVRDYRACAKLAMTAQVESGALDRSCVKEVRRCVRRSTCGRPGSVACCRSKQKGVQCQVTTPERCAARGGCAGARPSCCDACDTPGCAGTTTTTTLPQPSCGNGVVDPGEAC